MNYIYANNNITWRNFNVVTPAMQLHRPPWGEFVALPFLIAGAWDKARAFALETHADLPEGGRLALQVPHTIGRALKPVDAQCEELEDEAADRDERRRLRIALHPNGRQPLARIHLPAATAAASHMLVHIPTARHQKPHRVVIRQLYEDREVGRITWLLMPAHHGK